MSLNVFAQKIPNPLCFKVTNIAATRKTVLVFNYPIPFGQTVDLMQKPDISEENIKTSLIKGLLKIKILAGEITVTCSDISLVTFNQDQIDFLIYAGIETGITPTLNPYGLKVNVPLVGVKNGINRIFKTPETFLNGSIPPNYFRPTVYHNGKVLLENIDFVIEKSSIFLGTYNYDTIRITSFAPIYASQLFATYVTDSTTAP